MNRLQGRVEEPEVPFAHQLEQVVCEREGVVSELGELDTALERAQTELTLLENRKAANSETLGVTQQEVDALQDDVQKERRLLQRIETLTTEVKAAKRRYMEIDVPGVSMEALESRQVRLQEKLDSKTQAVQVWKQYEAEVAKWQQGTSSLAAEGQRWSVQFAPLKQKISEKEAARVEWDVLQSDLAAKTAQLSEETAEQKLLTAEMRSVKRAISEGVCSECERPFEGVDSHGMKDKLDGLVVQQQNCTNRVNGIETEVGTLNAKANPLTKIVHSSPEEELEKVNREIARIDDQLQAWERPQLSAEAVVKSEAECAAVVEECDQLKADLGAVASEMNAFKRPKPSKTRLGRKPVTWSSYLLQNSRSWKT